MQRLNQSRTSFLETASSARRVVMDLNWRLNTGCSNGWQYYLTHTPGVVYLLASIARKLFTEHLDRLSRVTLAVSSRYYLVAQKDGTAGAKLVAVVMASWTAQLALR
jgi:hypothetical protein